MLLTNSFKNDIRVLKEAKTLAENNYDIEILCWDRESELLEKEIELIDKIQIKRFYSYAKYGTGKKQLFGFLKFVYQVYKYLKNKEYDIIHAHDLDGLIAGKLILLFKKNKKILYDSHEFFSGYDSLKINKKNFFLEKILLKEKDFIITVSESIAQKLKQNYRIKNIEVIKNIPYYKFIKHKKNLLRKELNIEEDKIILLYQGELIKGRGLEKLIEVLQKLTANYVIVYIGKGNYKNNLLKYANEKGVGNRVYFKEFIENQKLVDYTNSGDIGFCLIEKKSLSYYYCLPNKLFEFIQGELPIISSNFPDLENIVLKNNIGISVNPENITEIAFAIEKIIRDKVVYSYNIKKCKKIYNWENESKKLLKFYKKLGSK